MVPHIVLFCDEPDLTAMVPCYSWVAAYDNARGGVRFASRGIAGQYLGPARAFGIGAIRVMIGDFIRAVRTWRWIAAPNAVAEPTTLEAIVDPPNAELEQEIANTVEFPSTDSASAAKHVIRRAQRERRPRVRFISGDHRDGGGDRAWQDDTARLGATPLALLAVSATVGHEAAPHSLASCLFSPATIRALTTPTYITRATDTTCAVNKLIDPGDHSPPTVGNETDPEDLAYNLTSLHEPWSHVETGDTGMMLLGAIMRRSDADG